MNKAARYFLLLLSLREMLRVIVRVGGGECWCGADGQMGVGACAGPTVENTAVCLQRKTHRKMKPVQGEMSAARQD